MVHFETYVAAGLGLSSTKSINFCLYHLRGRSWKTWHCKRKNGEENVNKIDARKVVAEDTQSEYRIQLTFPQLCTTT
jgi:hypothetical protein